MYGFSLGLLLACVAVIWAPGWDPAWFAALSACFGLLLIARRLEWPAVITGAALGLTLASISLVFLLSEPDLPEGVQRVEGRVLDQVGRGGGVARFTLKTAGEQADPPLPDRIRVSWFEPSVVPLSGERWQLPLRFHSSPPDVLPGGFDRDRWRFRNGLGASARVVRHRPAIRVSEGRPGLDRLRHGIAERIAQALPERPASALIRGVTVGDRGAFESSHWQVLNATGTTHLVAISGLHIGLIAGLGFLVCRRLAAFGTGTVPADVAGAVGGLFLALFYAALAGFALPTVRALLMFGVLVSLLFLRRRVPPGAGLALALAAVLILDSRAVMDPGFYLSFALVAFVLLVVAMGDCPGRTTAFVRVQWVTGLAVLPILLLAFGDGPVVGPLANALAVPVFSLMVVPISLLGVAFDLIGAGGLADVLWHFAAATLEMLWPVLAWLAQAPGLSSASPIPVWALVPGLLGIVAVLLPGPVVARCALVLAMLPAVVGLRDGDAIRIDHWQLRDDGHVWLMQAEGQRFIRVEASRSAIRPDLQDWLADMAGDPDTVLVLEPRDRTGPASLSRLTSPWPVGRVLLADARRAGTPNARHCHGARGPDLRFRVEEAGMGGVAECVLDWHHGSGHLVLSGNAMTWRTGEGSWRLERTAWQGVRSVRPKADGTANVVHRRTYWWQD